MSAAFYNGQRIPLRLIFTVLTRIRIDGAERFPSTGGVVVVCNHLTNLDPLILGVSFGRQLHFMAKEELFRIKPLGWWLRKSGTFPVRRDEVDRSALKHAEELLRAGEVVMIFPEGHRSATAQMQAARAGAVMLAARAQCPVLPVAIFGTELLRKGAHAQKRSGIFARPVVRVRVGEPIPFAGASGGRMRKAAAQQVMRQIVDLLPPSYHGVYAEADPQA